MTPQFIVGRILCTQLASLLFILVPEAFGTHEGWCWRNTRKKVTASVSQQEGGGAGLRKPHLPPRDCQGSQWEILVLTLH